MVSFLVFNHLAEREREREKERDALFFVLCLCSVSLPNGAKDWSTACYCDISCSFFVKFKHIYCDIELEVRHSFAIQKKQNTT